MLVMIQRRTDGIVTAQEESLGQRLARLRKERAFTQVQLAREVGTIQSHISAYELGRLRPNSDMMVHLAEALKVSADEILGLKNNGGGHKTSLKITKRMKRIESLPRKKQKAILSTIDALLDSSAK
jgi:transcriptional regulator with XRE-family HTH domain